MMAYRFSAEESFPDGAKRIATELIDQALSDIRDPEKDRQKTVHESRKRCKELRGLLRLIRPGLPTYSEDNASIRDAAKLLSAARDADVLLKTTAKLRGKGSGPISPHIFDGIQQHLEQQRADLLGEEIHLEGRIEDFVGRMEEIRGRVAEWRVQGKPARILADGLEKTYDQGRAAMKAAYNKSSTETFHEWRKRVKYYWYHVRLVTPIWEPVMNGFEAALDDLSDHLGDEHDLAVLHERLAESALIPEAEAKATLFALIEAERQGLRESARALGARLYAETPKGLAKRLRRYWSAWREGTRALRELADAPTITS